MEIDYLKKLDITTFLSAYEFFIVDVNEIIFS